jgi:hypothetical protein
MSVHDEQERKEDEVLDEAVESGMSLIWLAGILAALGVAILVGQLIKGRLQQVRSDVEERVLAK